MTDLVVATGLTREFVVGGERIRPVNGVDLTVQAGELVMILGRSGAGKTTLLSLIGALDVPDSGSITVADVQVETLAGHDRDRFLQVSVGWVFQTAGLVPMLTAQENVELSLRVAGVDRASITERAAEALVTGRARGPATRTPLQNSRAVSSIASRLHAQSPSDRSS